jgi:hypothetical protein
MDPLSWCSYVTTWSKHLSPTPWLSWGSRNAVIQDDGRVSLFSIAKTSPGCMGMFRPCGTSERLPTQSTWDIWSATIRKSSVKSVWHVDWVFLCRVYIDLNHRDSRIWVPLVCGSHHVDNLTNSMSLLVTDGVLRHLGDKWWCMTCMHIVFFCRYANHDCVS